MSDLVLVTGASGYLGVRVTLALVDAGYKVRVATRKAEPSSHLWLPKGSEVANLNLESDLEVSDAVSGVQKIVHLAAMNEVECQNNPEGALAVNGIGTLKLLKVAEKHGAERFLYFSTAHVYGTPLTGVLTETTLTRPIHPYAITHKVAEDFVLASNDLNRIEGVVIRLSNVIGAPGHFSVNRWTLLVNDLCRQAVVDRRLVLKTGGMQKRDFITLDDVCRATIHLLKIPKSDSDNGLFNLGGETTLSIFEMAQKIAGRCHHLFGFIPQIYRSQVNEMVPALSLDFRIDKLRSTGFKLNNNFDEEIDSTLRFCQRAMSKTL